MLWWVSVAPFGSAGGAGGELDVDRIVELQRRGRARPARRGAAVAAEPRTHRRSCSMPGRLRVADADHRRADAAAAPPAACRARCVELRRQLAQHAEIVAGLERVGRDQRLAADLVQRVFQLGEPVGRVDVDQDQPGLRGGELRQHPFGVVRRPDADPVAGLRARAPAGRRRTRRPWLSARR